MIKDRLGAGERPGRLRPQSPQGAPPGRVDLAEGHEFTHVVSLLDGRRTTCTRTRKRASRTRTCRSARTTSSPMRLRTSTRRSRGYLDDPAEKLYLHREEFGDLVIGVSAATCSTRASSRTARTRSRSWRSSPDAASELPAARSSPSRSTRNSPRLTHRRPTSRTMRTTSVAAGAGPRAGRHDGDEVALLDEVRAARAAFIAARIWSACVTDLERPHAPHEAEAAEDLRLRRCWRPPVPTGGTRRRVAAVVPLCVGQTIAVTARSSAA